MKKIILIPIILLSFSVMVFGQDKHELKISGGFSYAVTNGFAGNVYDISPSLGPPYQDGKRKSHSLPGLNFSASYSISSHFSLLLNVSGYRGSKDSTTFPGTIFIHGIVEKPTFILIIPGLNTTFTGRSFYNFMAGAEYRDLKSTKKLNPFAHLMVGLGIERANYDASYDEFTRIRGGKNYVSNSGIEADLGGGLDLSISRSFDLRLIQFDYNPFFPMKHNILTVGDARDPLNDHSGYLSGETISVNRKMQNNLRFTVGVVYHLGK